MSKFALKEIKEIVGRIKFFKLEANGICQFDEFLKECKKDGNLESELLTLQARMQQISDLRTMPVEKHRDITPKNDSIKEYEIKTKHLRIYTFHDKINGRIIALGGKKTTQKSDINKFRNLKREYLREYND